MIVKQQLSVQNGWQFSQVSFKTCTIVVKMILTNIIFMLRHKIFQTTLVIYIVKHEMFILIFLHVSESPLLSL